MEKLHNSEEGLPPYQKVMVIGVFDLIHRGHIEFLKKAVSFGRRIIVVINGDDMVSKYKRLPIFNESDRQIIVSSIRGIDEVVIAHDFNIKPLIEKYRPEVIVHGDDWPRSDYLRQICMTEEELDAYGVDLQFVPYFKGITTSDVIKRIKEI